MKDYRLESLLFALRLLAALGVVLLDITPGLSIKEAAEMLGICETTLKTHLQHIYCKTGTSKRTELLRLLINSVAPMMSA